jgi:hypothetical protein
MDWIIEKTEKTSFHTDLSVITKPFFNYIDDYNWAIFDLEFISGAVSELPINHTEKYFVLSPSDFKKIFHKETPHSFVQLVWGVILAIPIVEKVKFDENNLPSADGNSEAWNPGNFQHPKAQIEIVCFDSTCKIVKFKNEDLSNSFKAYFNTEAIRLKGLS